MKSRILITVTFIATFIGRETARLWQEAGGRRFGLMEKLWP